ncbi:MAG: thiamine pyrophosphate-dependent enzyme [Planctomycetota bacterium]|nr:thiamine pyrophosphate-dependent enzyme [Planctomycetota bacterium]
MNLPLARTGIESSIDQLELLKLMYLSREGDRREGILHRQSKGWFQVAGIGHETMAVLAMLMNEQDYLVPYYRDRAMVLARGVSNYDLALAYFAKRDSSSRGRQMPGHYSSRKHNIWSVATPTGVNCLPACGIAWAQQLRGESNIVVTTIGDAAVRQGEFYEAVCFAVERNLPVVFVVEDNRYGISTCTDRFNPFKLNVFHDALGIEHVDARQPELLAEAGTRVIEKARNGAGPSIVIAEVDRLCSHTSSDDHRVYRPPAEISALVDRDPIPLLAQSLIEEGLLEQNDWEELQEQITRSVDQDYLRAEKAADPEAGAAVEDVLGEAPVSVTVPELTTENGKLRMVDAVNQVFRSTIEDDQDTIFFGEDIEDPKGGVFGLTLGLSSNKPDQAFNSPLAEATIVGVAAGMASVGMKPVFEIQFADFVAPAWNQISQNLTTLRWRTGGDWTCPVVLYAPYGAYLPGGSIWHSQSNEAWFAHTPGMRVVVPSTPEDAAGLMANAMQADDPTFVLLPKHLIRKPFESDGNVEPVPFGKAVVRREGKDLTILSWANCMELALQAADELAEEAEAEVEVIDLRSISPWDKETVRASVEKTGRLLVVQEDSESCSAGQMIISELTSNDQSWYSFASAPRLISKPDVHIGYNPIYEYAVLPSLEDVISTARELMEE